MKFKLISGLVLVLIFLLSSFPRFLYAEKIVIANSGYIGRESLTYNGSEYGLVWGNEDLYFVKLDTEGNKIGTDLRISNLESSTQPSLVWNGNEYGVGWDGSSFEHLYFTRLDSSGNAIGNRINMNSGNRQYRTYPILVWNGDYNEYGLFWSTWDNKIYFARIGIDGNMVGESKILECRGKIQSIIWTGSEYGVGIFVSELGPSSYSNLYFFRLDESGNKIGDTVALTESGPVSLAPSLSWNSRDNEYGITFDSGYKVYFIRLDKDGNKIGNNILISSNGTTASYHSVVWTGTEYGVVWRSRIRKYIPEDNRYDSEDKLMFTILYSDSELDSDGNKIMKIMNAAEIDKVTNQHIGHISLAYNNADNQYAICWLESEDMSDNIYKVNFITIEKASLPLTLTGGAPSIYKNRIVYQKQRATGDYDIYLYSLKDWVASNTRITSNQADQKNPDIYEDIIVWQDNRNNYNEGGSYSFNWFGLINTCYASGLPNDDCWDIYMHNITTGEEHLVAGGERQQWGPQVYGDYITWHEGPQDEYIVGGERDTAQVPFDNIGIYKISTGEKEYLSDHVDITDLGSDYKMSENLLVYRKGNKFYKYNVLTKEEEIIPATIGVITGDYTPYRNIHAFNGEWLIYNEIFADGSLWGTEPPRDDFRQYLKAYNLVTKELITIKEEWYPWRSFGGWATETISGNKLLYLDDIESAIDSSEMGLWLYDLSNRTNTLIDRECRYYNNSGFNIWGNKVVYTLGNTLKTYSWDSNTNKGDNVNVGLGDGINIEFSSVTSTGETIIERSTGGFGEAIETGSKHVMFYNISTSAEYSGNIYITLRYDELGITDKEAKELELYHWNKNEWEPLERTTINETENTVTFITQSLSPFMLWRPNHPPKLKNIPNKTVRVGETLKFSISAADPDGDKLTYSAYNLPNGAAFTGKTFNWKPNMNQIESYRVTFSVTDKFLSDKKTVIITAQSNKKSLAKSLKK